MRAAKALVRLHPSVKTLILDAQNNHLIELVLLSTHNICFDLERRRIFFNHTYLKAGPGIGHVYEPAVRPKLSS